MYGKFGMTDLDQGSLFLTQITTQDDSDPLVSSFLWPQPQTSQPQLKSADLWNLLYSSCLFRTLASFFCSFVLKMKNILRKTFDSKFLWQLMVQSALQISRCENSRIRLTFHTRNTIVFSDLSHIKHVNLWFLMLKAARCSLMASGISHITSAMIGLDWSHDSASTNQRSPFVSISARHQQSQRCLQGKEDKMTDGDSFVFYCLIIILLACNVKRDEQYI